MKSDLNTTPLPPNDRVDTVQEKKSKKKSAAQPRTNLDDSKILATLQESLKNHIIVRKDDGTKGKPTASLAQSAASLWSSANPIDIPTSRLGTLPRSNSAAADTPLFAEFDKGGRSTSALMNAGPVLANNSVTALQKYQQLELDDGYSDQSENSLNQTQSVSNRSLSKGQSLSEKGSRQGSALLNAIAALKLHQIVESEVSVSSALIESRDSKARVDSSHQKPLVHSPISPSESNSRRSSVERSQKSHINIVTNLNPNRSGRSSVEPLKREGSFKLASELSLDENRRRDEKVEATLKEAAKALQSQVTSDNPIGTTERVVKGAVRAKTVSSESSKSKSPLSSLLRQASSSQLNPVRPASPILYPALKSPILKTASPLIAKSPSLLSAKAIKSSGSSPTISKRKTDTVSLSNDRLPLQIGVEVYRQLSDLEKKRVAVVWELLQTERDFVRDLAIILEVFFKPMMVMPAFGPRNLAAVFGNIEQIFMVNNEFLSRLEGIDVRDVKSLSELFVGYIERFMCYIPYCSNQASSKSIKSVLAKSEIKVFLEECYKNSLLRQLDIQAFLVKPVQRICKYPLLLKEVFKHTLKADPGYDGLKIAVDKMARGVMTVNECAKRLNGLRLMTDVQDKFAEKLNIASLNRFLVREDNFMVGFSERVVSRRIFLFNDLVLVARRDWRDRYHVVEKSSLKDVRVRDIVDVKETLMIEMEVGGEIGSSSFYAISAVNVEDKRSWLEAYSSLGRIAATKDIKDVERSVAIIEDDEMSTDGHAEESEMDGQDLIQDDSNPWKIKYESLKYDFDTLTSENNDLRGSNTMLESSQTELQIALKARQEEVLERDSVILRNTQVLTGIMENVQEKDSVIMTDQLELSHLKGEARDQIDIIQELKLDYSEMESELEHLKGLLSNSSDRNTALSSSIVSKEEEKRLITLKMDHLESKLGQFERLREGESKRNSDVQKSALIDLQNKLKDFEKVKSVCGDLKEHLKEKSDRVVSLEALISSLEEKNENTIGKLKVNLSESVLTMKSLAKENLEIKGDFTTERSKCDSLQAEIVDLVALLKQAKSGLSSAEEEVRQGIINRDTLTRNLARLSLTLGEVASLFNLSYHSDSTLKVESKELLEIVNTTRKVISRQKDMESERKVERKQEKSSKEEVRDKVLGLEADLNDARMEVKRSDVVRKALSNTAESLKIEKDDLETEYMRLYERLQLIKQAFMLKSRTLSKDSHNLVQRHKVSQDEVIRLTHELTTFRTERRATDQLLSDHFNRLKADKQRLILDKETLITQLNSKAARQDQDLQAKLNSTTHTLTTLTASLTHSNTLLTQSLQREQIAKQNNIDIRKVAKDGRDRLYDEIKALQGVQLGLEVKGTEEADKGERNRLENAGLERRLAQGLRGSAGDSMPSLRPNSRN